MFCRSSPLPHTHPGCRRQSWRTITQDQLLRTIVLASASSFYHAQSLQCDCQYLQWKGGRWNCSAGVASLKIGRLDKCLVLPTCQGDPGGGGQGHIKRNFGPAIVANQTDFLNHRVHIVFDPKIWFVIYCLPQSAIFFVVAEILLHFAALWVGSLGIGRRGGGGRRGVALALSGLGQPKPRRSVSALLQWVQFRVNGNSSSDVRLTVISIFLPIFCLISSFDFHDINHQCDDTYGINSC